MDRARQLAPVLAELMASGMSARQMAVELTARGIPTATGARWHTQTVLRMIDRVGEGIVDLEAAQLVQFATKNHDFGRFRTVSTRAREAEWELGTLATDNIVRHSRRAEITTLHEVLW